MLTLALSTISRATFAVSASLFIRGSIRVHTQQRHQAHKEPLRSLGLPITTLPWRGWLRADRRLLTPRLLAPLVRGLIMAET